MVHAAQHGAAGGGFAGGADVHTGRCVAALADAALHRTCGGNSSMHCEPGHRCMAPALPPGVCMLPLRLRRRGGDVGQWAPAEGFTGVVEARNAVRRRWLAAVKPGAWNRRRKSRQSC